MPSAGRRIFFNQRISNSMYSAPSGIVMNDYDKEPLPLTTQKWLKKTSKKKSKFAGKRVSENFESYYVKRLDEYAIAGREESLPAKRPSASVYMGNGKSAEVQPEFGEKFTLNELKKIIGSESLGIYQIGTASQLVVDLDQSEKKEVNVRGSLLLGNFPKTKGKVVMGNCMLIPIDLMPDSNRFNA